MTGIQMNCQLLMITFSTFAIAIILPFITFLIVAHP